MRTGLGKSNTAQHRHRSVDIVPFRPPKSAGGHPRLCTQYDVSQNDLTNNLTIIDYFVDYWISVLQLNSDPLGPKDHPLNSRSRKLLDTE